MLAGAVPTPLGPFSSSMDLLATGLFDKVGIKRIGVAGHPEGSPDISDAMILQALKWKNDFAERSDAEMYIATQFCFESAPIIAWDKAMQAEGNKLPIHIGIPGLATLKTLLGHAKACGIGNSMRLLTRQAKNVAKLLVVNAPDELVRDSGQLQGDRPQVRHQQGAHVPAGRHEEVGRLELCRRGRRLRAEEKGLRAHPPDRLTRQSPAWREDLREPP